MKKERTRNHIEFESIYLVRHDEEFDFFAGNDCRLPQGSRHDRLLAEAVAAVQEEHGLVGVRFGVQKGNHACKNNDLCILPCQKPIHYVTVLYSFSMRQTQFCSL